MPTACTPFANTPLQLSNRSPPPLLLRRGMRAGGLSAAGCRVWDGTYGVPSALAVSYTGRPRFVRVSWRGRRRCPRGRQKAEDESERKDINAYSTLFRPPLLCLVSIPHLSIHSPSPLSHLIFCCNDCLLPPCIYYLCFPYCKPMHRYILLFNPTRSSPSLSAP